MPLSRDTRKVFLRSVPFQQKWDLLYERRRSANLGDDIERVTVVGDTRTGPTDGARGDGTANPLIPNLDTSRVLTNIDGGVTTVRSTGEGGDTSTEAQTSTADARSSAPLSGATLMIVNKSYW
jgi:hypothetical protein